MSRRCTFTAPRVLLAGAIAFAATSAGIADGPPGLPDPYIDLGRGPVWIHEPAAYDPGTSWPLLVHLHGYGGSGAGSEAYFKFEPLIDQYGFFLLHPDGTFNPENKRFWNATYACCDFYDSGVDDSGYLRALVEEMKNLYNIDPRRIYFTGHSNGGFMSYRMACDHADTIAAIASLAGVTYYDPDDCAPAEPVHVLHIHGTADTALLYQGGVLYGMPYPGAVQTVETWAGYDGCELTGETLPPLNLDANLPGDETLVTRYATECDPGGSAELWTIVGGSHSPALSDDFNNLVIEFLLSHPKPDPCPADVSEDEAVDIDDLFQVLGAWGPCSGCPEDINASGAVDIDDIFEVLGAWGPC